MAMEMANPDAVRAIAKGNSDFGIRLYQRVKEEEEGKNLVMSPFSVSCVVAMASAGARSDTLEEMKVAMHFPEKMELLRGYSQVLAVLKGNGNIAIDAANNLFLQKGYQLLEDFVTEMKESFYAQVMETDFSEQGGEVARQLINDWVEEKTNEKIKDLIPEKSLNPDTRMVLVNAVYFKGKFTNKFDAKFTQDEDFYVGADEIVTVHMMKNKASSFKMMDVHNLKSKMIELPYVGGRVSMFIILPNEMLGLGLVEMKLSQINLLDLFSKIDEEEEQKVDLALPKFKLEKTLGMKDLLEQLGMIQMFTADADFTGITGAKELFVSEVLQKAFIEVNEEGTEATAATSMEFNLKESATLKLPVKLPEFHCDHPFLFFIQDTLTKMVLFSGRVVDPNLD